MTGPSRQAGLREAGRAVGLVVAVSWSLDRRAFLLATLEAAGGLIGNLFPLAAGLAVTGAASHDTAGLIVGAGLLVLATGSAPLLTATGVSARLRLKELVGHEFDRRVAELVGRVEFVEALESPALQDDLQVFAEQQGVLGQAYNTLLNTLNAVALPLAAVAVAAASDLRLLLLIPGALPGLFATRFVVGWDRAAEQRSAEPARRSAHLFGVMTLPAGASELRVLAARASVAKRHSMAIAEGTQARIWASTRTVGTNLACNAVYFGVAAAVLWAVVRDVQQGHAPVGVAVTCLLATGQMQGVAAAARRSWTGLAKVVRTSSGFRRLESEAHRAEPFGPSRRPAPAAVTDGIRLSRIGYRYPNTADPALRDVDLFLPAGAVVAIVGESGAGKSTLVNVLMGLTLPDTGATTVDGTDLRELDRQAWRRGCSAVFQTYLRPELTLQQAVGVGQIPVRNKPRRVTRALAAAGAKELPNEVADGLRTRLGLSWSHGRALSGGQWQKVAVARALMRTPLLLVLDEPTASLDAAAEHELFVLYAQAAKTAGARGCITLLVTHRLSSARGADLIVVLRDGAVVETGTHRELVAAAGEYADLYGLQAQGYADVEMTVGARGDK